MDRFNSVLRTGCHSKDAAEGAVDWAIEILLQLETLRGRELQKAADSHFASRGKRAKGSKGNHQLKYTKDGTRITNRPLYDQAKAEKKAEGAGTCDDCGQEGHRTYRSSKCPSEKAIAYQQKKISNAQEALAVVSAAAASSLTQS